MEFRVSEFKFEIDVNINVGSTLWSVFFSWDSNNDAFTDKIFKFSLTSFKAL